MSPLLTISRCKQRRLHLNTKTGGGGIRTPVPRCFKTGFYMLSRLIVFSPCKTPKRQALRSAISERSHLTGPKNRFGQPAILRPYQTRRHKSDRTSCQIRLPFATGSCQINCCRMINQAHRRPGHATCFSAIRSKPFAPVFTFQELQLLLEKLFSTVSHYTILYGTEQ